ncbi:MAG: hypothetical protein HOW73_38970 [Polyangiaceae bacterium]|nr:hypothetical protein [Polyangiaceae bacterium]
MRRRLQRAKAHLLMGGALAATALLGVGFAGCQGDTEDGITGSTCVSNDEYFAVLFFEEIKETCGSCHISGEGFQKSDFKMVPPSQAGFLDTNMEAIKKIASYEANGKSVILQKPLGELDHGGGKIFDSEEDPRYQKLVTLVDRIKGGESCPNTEARFLAGVQMSGPQETFRKAALTLAARLPTDEEIAAVEKGDWAAVDQLLEQLMDEPAFLKRVKEKYNDVYLTDFYLRNEDFDVIGGSENYNPRWFDEVDVSDVALQKKYGARDQDDLYNKLSGWTARGVAQQSLELIAYTIKNNIPFTNVVTADYIVVNPFSAKAFNITDVEFENDANPDEFVKARLGGYDSDFPHAGNLTDPIWLQRHPTTETNRNRHRAREILYVYMGNDILKAAERPIAIDENSLADNPTMNNDTCTVCHYTLDPVASVWRNFQPTFQNGDDAQFDFRPDADWFLDMFQSGFAGQDMPASQYDKATKWGGQQIANDPGFAFGATFMAYRILTGNEPLSPPQKGTENFDQDLTAFLGQYYTFSKIAHNFREGGYNFKSLMKELVMSPYFRSINTATNIDPAQIDHLTAVGSAHLLTPEQLNRKIENVLGVRWTWDREWQERPFLQSDYKILFGGIDSRDTTTRITSPSGIMSNVAERMGLEAGCRLVNAEFSIPIDQRRFLKNVEMIDEPQDANYRDVPGAIEVIKTDIQYLHQQLLGEKLDINDPEIERTYQLFVDVWKEGKTNVLPTEGGWGFPWACVSERNYVTGEWIPDEQRIEGDEFYTGRAWSAVLAYMLTDYSFLYE